MKYKTEIKKKKICLKEENNAWKALKIKVLRQLLSLHRMDEMKCFMWLLYSLMLAMLVFIQIKSRNEVKINSQVKNLRLMDADCNMEENNFHDIILGKLAANCNSLKKRCLKNRWLIWSFITSRKILDSVPLGIKPILGRYNEWNDETIYITCDWPLPLLSGRVLQIKTIIASLVGDWTCSQRSKIIHYTHLCLLESW